MLPDFPVQKAKLSEFWNEYLRKKHYEYLGYFANIPSHRHYEGNRWHLEREDGTVSNSEYGLIEDEFSVHIDEVPSLTPEKIAQKLDKVAEEMARQMVRHIVEDISQAAEKVGNTVDAGGRRLTKETFLEALYKMLLSFDKQGNLKPPAILIHPKLWESIKNDVTTWEEDPEFVARHEEIIVRKREIWHDRESRRKLVD